jgi:hypothetical protein
VRAQIIVTDSLGQSFQGVVDLVPSHGPTAIKLKKSGSERVRSVHKVNFDLPMRNFIKTYGHGMSGQAKFALVVAFLAAGKFDKVVAGGDVKKYWNTMTALLGPFNLAYATRAKDQGWVDSKQRGSYTLRQACLYALESDY